ncbi:MAG: hypothetical protein INH37_13630 [Myxococcaceae bacterium]|nr:hypothetical protein [Myxococcaceae bacterium]
MRYALTVKSRNAKTGPIAVSTSTRETCPDACPLKGAGCYAESGPLGMFWGKVSSGKAGHAWGDFLAAVRSLPRGTMMRHNQAGDLPGQGDAIDTAALAELTEAARGLKAFTYTHKPITPANTAAIKAANGAGFTVNLSANNLSHADTLADTGAGPVAVVLPGAAEDMAREARKRGQAVPTLATPKGRKVVVCPATYRDDVTCKACGLCAIASRKVVVGFPVHGASHKRAERATQAA